MSSNSLHRLAGIMLMTATSIASAELIDFTGGTVHLADGTTVVTSIGNDFVSNADYYVEDGFQLDFIGDAEYIGDYYGPDASGENNDVIHGHWAPSYGGLTSIDITKVGGGTFDLNYFILTSNSIIGGGPATGEEMAWIEAWVSGAMTFYMLLPAESWGWDGVHNPGLLQNDPGILLGSEFDAVDMVRITVTDPLTGLVNPSNVFCFGMDEFFIDEPAPIPEPGTLALLSLGLLCIAARRRKTG